MHILFYLPKLLNLLLHIISDCILSGKYLLAELKGRGEKGRKIQGE
jgi:hypothetical protein